jgi:hypothetical protein
MARPIVAAIPRTGRRGSSFAASSDASRARRAISTSAERCPGPATIGVEGTEVVLRSRAAGAAWVDGHPVDVARLEGGEQVVVGDEHYVVDVVRQAPPAQAVPKPQGGESEPAAQPPGAGDPIDSTPRSGFSPWWLLAASALIAGALAMLLGRISG